MKIHVQIRPERHVTGRWIRRAAQAVVPALLLAHAAVAQTVNIYYVPWDANDAWDEIQNTINGATTPAKVILTDHSTPWYTSKQIVIDKSDIQIWFANGGDNTMPFVMAKTGGHPGTGDALFRIRGDNVKINGYHNGVDASQGVATLEMLKAEYMSRPTEQIGESRHCINVRGGNNITIQGLNLVRSGGDGIAINPKEGANDHIPASNVIINDVTCDDNFRQGISIISVDTLTATDCVFKNTGLTGATAPTAGVDLEPSRAYDSLQAVKFVNCQFIGNKGNNVEINLHALDESLAAPIDIRFESCLIEDGNANGLAFYSLAPTVGPTGTIVVKNTTITNANRSGILFSAWNADRVAVTMANVDVVECNPTADWHPILFTQSTPSRVIGDVVFQSGCHIHESFTRTKALVYAGSNAQAAGLKDITGTIDVHRPASSTGPLINLGTNTTNCTLSVTLAP